MLKKTDPEILTDFYVLSLPRPKYKDMVSVVPSLYVHMHGCIYVRFSSAWAVGYILFIFGIQAPTKFGALIIIIPAPKMGGGLEMSSLTQNRNFLGRGSIDFL